MYGEKHHRAQPPPRQKNLHAARTQRLLDVKESSSWNVSLCLAKDGGEKQQKEGDFYDDNSGTTSTSPHASAAGWGLNRAGKPAACTTNGFETLRDAEWSAIKRVKRANLSLLARSQVPVECESLPRSAISYTRRLLPPPSMMNEPSSKVESSSSSSSSPVLQSLVCWLGGLITKIATVTRPDRHHPLWVSRPI
ncbi:hypothetical protein DAPPUDRAFT_238314 [Daphnia pulex]|uniref:Uncharacterized protein n=1 Tax=Daphnia pulex TaxID=6669 RepID=E9G637_DAPPU|nr:hypothetical protein DAPPUDRAFT_238314 [Daphnia pulex]|eukprot:EFX85061.1 hypothetical protein DAPPUDRAFT_238314 [Daphnia pulex]